jgi:hypothetical protein
MAVMAGRMTRFSGRTVMARQHGPGGGDNRTDGVAATVTALEAVGETMVWFRWR